MFNNLFSFIMKNMFKNVGKTVLFTCLSLMLLTACGQKSKLKLAIAAANKQCPMDMGASGEISSITFDGADVVYVLLMNESFLNIDALKENPDAMKSAVTVMFGNPQGSIKEMLDLVVGTDSGMKFIYKGKTSGNEVECYLTTQDLKDILNGGSAAESSDKKKLEEQVKMTNVSCPMQVDEATLLNKLTIESDKVLYHYTIDESVVQMSALKENAEQMKANVKNSLNSSDPALRMFLEYVRSVIRVGYLYKGNKSRETFEISFWNFRDKGSSINQGVEISSEGLEWKSLSYIFLVVVPLYPQHVISLRLKL